MKRLFLAFGVLVLAATQCAAGFLLLTSPFSGGGPGTGVVVNSQSLRFGNQTAQNAGLATVVSTGDLITVTSCTGANSTDFTIGNTGTFTPTAVGASGHLSHGPYSFSCLFNNAANATITINVDADAADVGPTSPGAEFTAAVAAISSSVVPRTVYLRPGVVTGTLSDNIFKNNTWTGLVTITSRDNANRGTIIGSNTANISWDVSSWGYVKFYQVKISCQFDRTQMNDTTFCINQKGTQRGPVTFEDVEIFGTPWTTLGPGVHFRGLIGGTYIYSGSFSLKNSLLHDSRRGLSMTLGAGSTADVSVTGNEIHDISVDFINVTGTWSAGGAGTGSGVFDDNSLHSPFTDTERISFLSNACLTKTGSLTGAVDGTKALFAMQIEFGDAIGKLEPLFAAGGVSISRTAAGFLHLIALDTTGATALDMTSAATVGSYRRIFILASLDTTGTSRMEIFRENVEGTGSWSADASTAAAGQTLDLTGASTISSTTTASSTCAKDSQSHEFYVSEVLFWQNQTADVTDPAVQANFAYAATNAAAGQWLGMRKPASVATGVYGAGSDWLVGFYGNIDTVWRTGVNQANGGVFTRSGTLDQDHGDLVQFAPRANIYNGELKRNAFISARSGSLAGTRFDDHLFQCYFMEDITTAFNYTNFDIEYNACATISGHGVSLYNAVNSIVSNNTMVVAPSWTSDYVSHTPQTRVLQHQSGTASGNNVSNNVSKDSAAFGTGNVVANDQEVTPGTAGPCTGYTDCTYADLFVGDGSGGFELQTIAQLKAWFSAKPGGRLDTATPKIGALFGGAFGP